MIFKCLFFSAPFFCLSVVLPWPPCFSSPSRDHCLFCLSSTVRCLPKDPCRHFSFTTDCFTLQRNLPSNLCRVQSALEAPGQPDRLKHFLHAVSGSTGKGEWPFFSLQVMNGSVYPEQLCMGAGWRALNELTICV